MPPRASAHINLAAIERNTTRLCDAAPSAVLCAVVKADGYGHGSVAAARAALAGGASWLAVATAPEASQLRAAGIDGPILILGVLDDDDLHLALAADADIVAWDSAFLERMAHLGGGRVHIKLDTGMGRLGTRNPEEATRLAWQAARSSALELVGLTTHFATADDRGDAFFDVQLERFSTWSDPLKAAFPGVIRHAANSAALLRDRASHFELVRPGVALYGLDPFGEDAAQHQLEPALELRSFIGAIKPCAAGESAGYGRRFIATRATSLATVPIGYGDGWRRGLTNNAEVLVGARRVALVGTVSMDNITIDLGAAGVSAGAGDEVVLVGQRGEERITAEALAQRLATINYEVTCGITARVPRIYHRDGAVVDAG